MPRTPLRDPSTNWGLTEDQVEDLRRYFIDEKKAVQKAAHLVGISSTLAQQIVKHKGWVPAPDPSVAEKPNEPQ